MIAKAFREAIVSTSYAKYTRSAAKRNVSLAKYVQIVILLVWTHTPTTNSR